MGTTTVRGRSRTSIFPVVPGLISGAGTFLLGVTWVGETVVPAVVAVPWTDAGWPAGEGLALGTTPGFAQPTIVTITPTAISARCSRGTFPSIPHCRVCRAVDGTKQARRSGMTATARPGRLFAPYTGLNEHAGVGAQKVAKEDRPLAWRVSTGSLVSALVGACAVFLGTTLFLVSPQLITAMGLGRDDPTPVMPTPTASPTATTTPATRVSVKPTTLPALKKPLSVRVLFGHQSEGEAIFEAVPSVYRRAKIRQPQVGPWRQVWRENDPIFANAEIGEDGDEHGKMVEFAELVNEASAGGLDVALMTFSYVDFDTETDVESVFDEYSTMMTNLQEIHPDIIFIYTTVPMVVDSGTRIVGSKKAKGIAGSAWPHESANIARERYNELVRQQYRETGRLFDIAALEARAKDDRMVVKNLGGEWYPVLNPDLADDDGEHLNATGGRQLATELMKLVTAVSAKS